MKKFFKPLILILVFCLTPFLYFACKKEPPKFSVEVPTVTNGCGYEIIINGSSEKDNIFYVKENSGYSFTLVVDRMYDISKVIIKANDVEIPVIKNIEENTIMVAIDKITSNVKYTVHNLVKKQLTADFKLVKYSTGNLEATTSSLGLEEVSILLGNKSYSLKQLTESNVNLFALYGDSLTFKVKANETGKYLNLDKLFVIGTGNFKFDSQTNKYIPQNDVKYLTTNMEEDENGWITLTTALTENTTIYINNEILEIHNDFVIKPSGLNMVEHVNVVYGNNFDLSSHLINPNDISISEIKILYKINDTWTEIKPQNVGYYNAKIYFEGNKRFEPFEKEFGFNIEKRTIAYIIKSINIIYGQTPEYILTENKTLNMGFVGSDSLKNFNLVRTIKDSNDTVITELNVGEYKINYSASASNYNFVFSTDAILTVNPAELPSNIISASNINKIYDKQSTTLQVDILTGFEDVSLTYKTFKFVNKEKVYLNSSSEKPSFVNVFNGGVDIVVEKANYNTKTISVTVNIGKATLQSGDITVNNVDVIYDGFSHEFNIQTSSNINIDNFTITFNGLSTPPSITDVNIDNLTYYEIIFTSDNYNDFILQNKYIKVNKATLSNSDVNVENIDLVYDGNPHSFNIVINNNIKDEFVITYNNSSTIPAITNSNEDNIEYYNIKLTNKNYNDFILENKYIKISKATPTLVNLPTYNNIFVGDSLTSLVINGDYEIKGVKGENLSGNLDILNRSKIVNNVSFNVDDLRFVPDSNNYNSLDIPEFIISATQLTVNVPLGVKVINLDTSIVLEQGLNNINNNTNLKIEILNIEGYTLSNLKINGETPNYDSESDSYKVTMNGENLIISIDYQMTQLVVNTMSNMENLTYKHGELMGQQTLIASHSSALTYTYSWYKLKDEYVDNSEIKELNINEQVLNSYYIKQSNITNTLKVFTISDGGYYIGKAETTVKDVEEKDINLVAYTNLFQVTTIKARCYISTPPTYSAGLGDKISEIEFTGSVAITEDGRVIEGEISLINLPASAIVSESATSVEFIFVPQDSANYYFDQTADSGIQNYTMDIVKNCYVYTFVKNEGGQQTVLTTIKVKSGDSITLPSEYGNNSWKMNGKFVKSGTTGVIGETTNFLAQDMTIVAG